MNELLATQVTAIVTGENEQSYFLQKNGQTILLDKSEGEHGIGDAVKVFIYTDKKQKPKATTVLPTASRENYGWGTVTDVRKDLGVFVNIGLPDKDVVISLDNLPELKNLWPKVDDKLYVKLDVDAKDRIWATLADNEVFRGIAGRAYNNMQDQDLKAIVYRLKLSGTFVYLPENNMLGFIHPSERFSEPRLGEELNVRVIGYRDVDKALNLSIKPRSHEMLDNDGQMILAYLEGAGGFMSLNDKSSPDDIKATFGISKGQFKKALGGLMKAKKVKQDEFGTELIANQPTSAE
ncbi:S1 RNA-binding domain-containing protein [Floricoccus penangensis]|uniref:CvfB family protein n=1 Tax=Floricoccus penangensis TaxID=1859475 RepID=UPI00203B6ACD|nr:S1 RNA-binding domain-containing protein [Floricoccus penangensis]URZ86931.1 S1 RNA-binding domain-containing protein [Floricoccus penangensis]